MKCSCTLISCEWAYGTTLSLIPPSGGVEMVFCIIGVDQAWVMLLCHGWGSQPSWSAWSHITWHMYTKCFGTLICCGCAYGSALSTTWKLGYCPARMIVDCRDWGSRSFWIASHIHFKCIQSDLIPWFAVDGHTFGCTLTQLPFCRSGVDFWKIGIGSSPSDVVLLWLRLQICLKCILYQHQCHLYATYFSILIWAYGCAHFTSILCMLDVCVFFGKLGCKKECWYCHTQLKCIPHSSHCDLYELLHSHIQNS